MKVNINGTIGKDNRPNSGLDDIGDKVNSNRLQRVAVVAIMEYHGHHEVVGQPETVSLAFAAIEPVDGKDDLTVRNLIDKYRKARGIGPTELTLFDAVDDERDGDAKGPWPGDPEFKAPEAAGDQDDTDTAKTEAEPKTRRRIPAARKAVDSE